MSETQQEVPVESKAAPQITAVAKQARENDDRGVLDWLGSFGDIGTFRVQVYRVKPEFVVMRGEKVKADGYMAVHNGAIEEEAIKDRWGGGTYELRVQTQNAKGSWTFFKSRRIEIPGKSKVDVDEDAIDERQAASASNEATPLAQQAITVMRGLVEKAEEKAGKGNNDVQAIIEAATGPLLEQIKSMKEDQREDRKAARERESERALVPTTAPATERLLERMVDGSDQRIDAIRTQFDSERRQLQTYWEGQVQRAEDNGRRAVESMEKAHEREMRSVEKAHEAAIKTTETAMNGQIEGLKREIGRLEREAGAMEKELAELRAQKTKSPLESIREVKELKDLLNEKDEDDEGGGSTVERVVSTIINSSPIAAIAGRIASAAPQQTAPAQPTQDQILQAQIAQMPPRRPFQVNGRTYMKLETGQVVPIKPKKRAAAATPAVEGEAQAPAEEQMPAIPAEDLAQGLAFLENAIQSRTEPKDFALTAKAMAPQIAGILRKFGAEKLIGLMNPREDSPVFTQRGKMFVREVAAALTE
jgi:hypothetical protein